MKSKYLDTVVFLVEELATAEVHKDGITGVIDDVVGRDGGQRASLGCVDTTLQADCVLLQQQLFSFWKSATIHHNIHVSSFINRADTIKTG